MKERKSNQLAKELVGRAAAQLVENEMVCGIGTGSTVEFLIAALQKRIREESLELIAVPTSYQARMLCLAAEIPVREIADFSQLDLAIDGADQVDPNFNLIKGGGAAHTREKIVASMAKEFVVIVDEAKLVTSLGQSFPLPVEVLCQALPFVCQKIKDLGGQPSLRMGLRKDGPILTDNGQFVVDVSFTGEMDLKEFDFQLKRVPGVIETGFFGDLVSKVLVGCSKENRVRVLTKNN